MDEQLQQIFNSILDGDSAGTTAGVQAALDSGQDPATILNEGMIAAMTEVGQRFECGDYFVPEMLIAARAMQAGLALLKPRLKEADVKSTGKVVIGTVKGDLHDIGMSALLTTTMPNMKATVEALKLAGVREQVKVIIGGAPITEAYAQQIGADGYSPDASRAVSLAKSLVS